MQYYCARANRVFIKLNNLIQLVSLSLSLSLFHLLNYNVINLYIWIFFVMTKYLCILYSHFSLRANSTRHRVVTLAAVNSILFEFFNIELLDDLCMIIAESTIRVYSTTRL